MVISFVVAFLVFPAAMGLLKKQPVYFGFEKYIKLIGQLGNIVEKTELPLFYLVLYCCCSTPLAQSGSEIYQGMKVIDTSLGGSHLNPW
jgi:hypothetical protein